MAGQPETVWPLQQPSLSGAWAASGAHWMVRGGIHTGWYGVARPLSQLSYTLLLQSHNIFPCFL